ncbi:MAG: PilZ domain-containing protein [Bdellovibrionaceae bacterium]|nr:PilZ domain-containing protein [Pseudobdellovibrionaceae bacterium]
MSDRRRSPLVRAIFDSLPSSLRFSYMRNQLNIPKTLDSRFRFKVANTQDELSSAYRILHESYLEKGYTAPNESGMRIVKYFALPTTTTLIALFDNTVVGTISIIRRSTFGIPMESSFNISDVLDNNKVIAEISSLAIDCRFREKRGALFLPLLKYFWAYVKSYMRLDAIVITVNPSMTDFYEGFLGFRRLKNAKVGNYSYANGNPGIGLWFDIHSADELFIKLYNHKTDEKNLYKYFYDYTSLNFEFPNRDFYKSSDPVMTPKMLQHFFIDRSTVFKELSTLEIMGLVSCYPLAYLSNFFPDIQGKIDRSNVRHQVNIQCHLNNKASVSAIVLDVSNSGVKLLSSESLDGMIHLTIPITNDTYAKVAGVVRWEKDSIYGIQLLSTDSAWIRFCRYLQNDFEALDSPEAKKAA